MSLILTKHNHSCEKRIFTLGYYLIIRPTNSENLSILHLKEIITQFWALEQN